MRRGRRRRTTTCTRAVAIHPNDAGDATDEVLAEIAALAALPHVRAVGETGLDYYRDWADQGDQQRSFRAHIDIAKRTGKALVIHDRDAHDDVLRILAEEGAPEQVVFHCFSGDAEMAKVCADRGYVMSFAGNVTFKNAGPPARGRRRRAAGAAPGGDRRAVPHADAAPRPAATRPTWCR